MRRRLLALSAATTLCLSLSVHAQAQTAAELYEDGVEARQEQRFDQAADLLRRALVLQPQNSDALVQLGFAELGRGSLAAARTAFVDALEIAPDYSDARFGLAQVEFRSGDLKAALAIIEPLAATQPDNAEVAALLASVRQALEAERSEAAPQLEKPRPPAATPKPEIRRDPVAPLMAEGLRLRTSGQFGEAEAVYRRALALSPQNTDVLVALGLAAGFQQKFEESARFFDSALAIDPALLDARLGKARLAIWTADLAQARTQIDAVLATAPRNSEALLLDARIALLERDYGRAEQGFAAVVAAEPTNAEALVGLGDVRRARGDETGARQVYGQALVLEPGSDDIEARLAAPPLRKWRLDLGSEVSDLSAGRGTWTDSGVGLSYRLNPETTLGARMRLATRFGETDLQLEGRVDHAFTPSLSVYGTLAGTPDADFLADLSFGAGASWRAFEENGPIGPVLLGLDTRYDVFGTADIATISPWLQVYLLDERLALTARWIHAEDDASARSDGYLLRADFTLTDRLGAFAGYSNAPEISDGLLIDTRTVFGGLSFAVTDDLTLRASYAHEQRATFDRDTFGFGLSVQF